MISSAPSLRKWPRTSQNTRSTRSSATSQDGNPNGEIEPMSADTFAVSLARIVVAAGEPVASIYARGFEARRKADASPVTDADLAAEHVILDRLAAAFPGVPAVAEECVSTGSVPELGD